MNKTKAGVKPLDLALQGGGSHGAFTWGVLDHFLTRDDISLEGICGTSAGAVNGTLLAYGLIAGGREAAQALLHTFWYKASKAGMVGPLRPGFFDYFFGNGNLDYSPGYLWFQNLTQMVSPYQFNPHNNNPLRDILADLVDFEQLRNEDKYKLFVCATNVRRGRLKVFKRADITLDAVMASACLPYLYQAVTINGEDYWDGGFMGNPPIFPLIDGTSVRDILLVQINPINIKETPKTSLEIQDRMNEISFNSSLMLEMRRVYSAMKMLEKGISLDGKLRDIHIHVINPEEKIASLSFSSKLNTDWRFLCSLRDLGRQYAEDWLDKNYEQIGKASTCNIRETFM